MIKDQQASRRHARITVTDVVVVTDLGSKNGVVIDGTAITTPTVLRPGNAAMLGDLTLSVRDHLRAVEAAPATVSSSTARRGSPARMPGCTSSCRHPRTLRGSSGCR